MAADNFAGAVEEYAAALEAVHAASPVERCRLLVRLAVAQYQRGDFDAALTSLAAARKATRGLGDRSANAHIAAELAHTLTGVGRYRRARRYALYAYHALRNSDDHRTVAQAGVSVGLCYARLGATSEAIEWLQNAAATFRRIDDADGLATALNNLGLVYKNLREWREATRYLEQGLRIDERAGLYARMRPHNQNLGLIRYYLGQWDLAEENFRRALQISRDTGHQQGEATALLALGRLARRRRQFDRAEEQFRRALELAERVGAERERLLALEFMAEVALDRGHPAEALALLEPALADAMASAPQGDIVAELEIRVGLALLGLSRNDEAHRHLLNGATLADRLGDRLEQALAERALARFEATRGNLAGLDVHVRGAIRGFESLAESYELATTLAAWGECLLLLPAGQRQRVELEPVADAAKRAATLFRELGVVPLAADAMLTLARLEAEREFYDHAVTLLEQAEQWLREASDPEAEDRAAHLRRELEQQYVAISVSSCNEFRALEEANRLFRDTTGMDGLLAQTVKLAVEHAGGDRGFVAFSQGGGRLEVVAQHGLGRDRARRILAELEGVSDHRLIEAGPLFSSRVAADPRFSGALGGAFEGVGSLVTVPLSFPSQSVGLVYVDRFNDNLLGAFKQRELNLLAVLANSAGVAIVEAQRSLLLQENRVLRQQLKPTPGMDRVISQSREMSEILTLLSKVGDSSATVLFMGETGTGKGLLAQVVHEMSNRRDHAFVQVNCAALPEPLLESELFGYVHGAFTGATRDKNGLFEEAHRGTIFLDEIEKVPESVQAKLLHVLDRGEVRPVGATRSRAVNARVICATGVDLRERIKDGRFLEDLYYRLNDITVRVPALRERREDIPVLAQHFLTVFSRQMEKPIRGFAPEVVRTFLGCEWRGNVRELEKTVKRMVVLADEGDTLSLALLPAELRERAEAAPERSVGHVLRSNVAQLERRMIAESLERCRWNKARAARELGLSYPTLLSKIRTLKIERRRGN
ncbi:MAG: sigma 54-interacting transcriptional regulator [Candidatus Eisenbacteria bacterium]|uniref:Sigma 54-interacting transcriptional regulator n=1 Tax=Eiseniibacteriota bacterium TaxID=2212470 RepID=A0A9D6QQ24_UNCEI|nr:sigma 54-interacting transcriptional regulator [Candidatus Eisenbacteria bacterium]